MKKFALFDFVYKDATGSDYAVYRQQLQDGFQLTM